MEQGGLGEGAFWGVRNQETQGNGPGLLGSAIAIPLGGAGSAAWLAELAPPVAAALAAAYIADAAETAAAERTFVTYIKRHASGSVYIGRASGYGDPLTVMKNRDASHHMNALGYGPAQLDMFVQGFKGTPGMGYGTAMAAYAAIRGREQQMIDFYGGVGNPMVGNSIRGVAYFNPLGRIYHEASNIAFGQVAAYTGF